MKVMLVDTTQYSPATPLFADCLGEEDRFFDEASYLTPIGASIYHKIGYLFLRRPITAGALNRDLLMETQRLRPDLLLMIKGQFIQPKTLIQIKKDTGATLICVGTDDPWNSKVSSRDLLAAIPYYDCYLCVRKAMIPDVLAAGCPRAEFIMCGFNPKTHFPPQTRFTPGFDVTMIGGADADRRPFALALASLADTAEVGLQLYGGYWERDPILRRFAWGTLIGDQYRKTLWLSKIAICLVRRANRDDHTMKTFELPACGVCTLFEDTDTHRGLFGALNQDIFFRTPEELVRIVRHWLGQPAWRERLAKAECVVVRQGHHSWADRYAQILALAQEIRATRGILNVRA